MTLILELVEWRHKQLLKVYDFTDISMSDNERKTKLVHLSDKLQELKYISHDEKILSSKHIYWLIKKLMWHGIINYEIEKNTVLITYLYYPYYTRIFPQPYDFYYEKFLLNHESITSNRNIDNMQQLIITYYMLIDVIMNDLIIDMRYETKKQIYNIMLIKN